MDHLAFMLEPVSPQALQLYCLKATFHQQASVPLPRGLSMAGCSALPIYNMHEVWESECPWGSSQLMTDKSCLEKTHFLYHMGRVSLRLALHWLLELAKGFSSS